jgi:plasmid stabilization system protein ParE
VAYEIIFSIRATENYFQITDYLLQRFSENTMLEFDRLLDEKINFISEHPFAFTKVNDYDLHLRKCIINQITILYYDVYENRIEILALFDGRQNPDKLNLLG